MRETDRAWMARALCHGCDPETFFPIARPNTKEGYTRAVKNAQVICRNCPVIAECAGYAFRHEIRFGVWGGIDMGNLPHPKRVRFGAVS
jgi:WhiB family redox-sensing transcriptional regulator